MKYFDNITLAPLWAAALLAVAAPAALAGTTAGGTSEQMSDSAAMEKSGSETEMSGTDVQKEVDEAIAAIKAYTYEQRQEAMEYMRALIDKADRQIEAQQATIKKNWEDMTQAAREQASESLATLRRYRKDLSERYAELQESSEDAWNDLTAAFSRSYEKLQTTWSDNERKTGKKDKSG
jgi:hypothetical protein